MSDRDTGRCGVKEGQTRTDPGGGAVKELVQQALERGLSLTGPDGLLKQLTKMVLETALD